MEPDPVFQRALDNFKGDLTAQQRRDFKITTLQDVKDEVNKIQIQHGSAKKLRGMSRMSKFLEAMKQLEQVISVFLNVSEVVAFIWVASSRLEILECLLNTFTDISEAIPGLQGYASVFEDQPEVLGVLERCYGDIIQFYHTAYRILGRPGAFGIRDWRSIFDSVWKTFRTKFSPILSSLQRHRELLEQAKLTATFGEVRGTRRVLLETIEKSAEELKQILDVMQQKRKQILDKLGNQGLRDDKGHRRLPDQRYPTSGDWILKEELFTQWLGPNDLSDDLSDDLSNESSMDLLYLNGMPGAGKTTLVSRIMDSLNEDITSQEHPLLNFYFENGQSGKTLMIDMLRSFIEQILQQDDAIVDDIHQKVLPARSSDLSSVPWLESLATRIILAQKKCYIIVDGLDECPLDQRKHILQWLKTILFESKVSNVVVKILVSGQRDGVVDVMLQGCAITIRLDDQQSHLRDIEAFSTSVLNQIKHRFPDLEDEEEMLKKLNPSRITEASKGMFMYAKVVLDNFLSQTSIYELEQELGREYPRGLDEAYDRVAERVLEKTSDSRKRAALQILGLMVCAARPLKWREIQCYFCIDATKGHCDPRRRKVGEPKDFCSSFVESEACISFPNMPSEAQVMIVHNTAKSYLVQSGRLDMVQQHLKMSLFCFRYLTRSAMDVASHSDKVASTTALTGHYGFFDYAAAHWDDHSLQYVHQASLRQPAPLNGEDLRSPLSAAWMEFAEVFREKNESLSETSSDCERHLDTSRPYPVFPGTIDTNNESGIIQELFEGWNSTQRSTEFESLAVSLRQIMQQIDLGTLQNRQKAVYLSLNGPFQPKCTRRACAHFNKGFESESDLSLHVSWHEMAFKCPHMGCYAWLAGFPTRALLHTHLKRAHPAINSEKRLFPVKSQSKPRSLTQACRLGDIECVQKFSASRLKNVDALYTAAQCGHFEICVYLTRQGCNPYIRSYKGRGGFTGIISAIQVSIRLGDYDLFSALRSAAEQRYETTFIEHSSDLLGCILDALESPIPQFLVCALAWNSRRTVPFTMKDILFRARMVTERQEHGCRTLSYIKRQVLIEDSSVRKGLQTLISSELEMYEKRGQSPELGYEQVFIQPDDIGRSLLHRLCDDEPEHSSSEAVRFLLTKLTPEDARRHDFEGNPPLFTAMRASFRVEGAALDDQANIIRGFYEDDSDSAKHTRNAAGQGPLEFALRNAKLQIFSLVFELSDAGYSPLHLNVLAYQTDWPPDRACMVFGIDCVAERVHMAVEVVPEQLHRFIWWLTGLNNDTEVIKKLKSLIADPHGETTRADSLSGAPTSNDMLQSDRLIAGKAQLYLHRAVALPERCRPKLEDLGRTQLRKLLAGFLRVKMSRFDIAEFLSIQHKLGHDSAGLGKNCQDLHEVDTRGDEDPKIISLLRRDKGYADFSSRETQEQLIQALGDSLFISNQAGTPHPDGLREFIETLIQYADSAEDCRFVTSLEEYIRHYFQ